MTEPFPQPGRKTAFIWNVAGGWVSNLVLIVQGVVFIPLYLHFIGDRMYGFWLATGGILAWFSMMDIGAAGVTKQRVAAAYGRKDWQGIIDYFWHGLTVMAGIGVLFTLLILTLSSRLPSVAGADPEYWTELEACLLLSASATLAYLINLVLKALLEALQRNAIKSMVEVFGGLLNISVTFLALTVYDYGLWSIPLGYFARQLFEGVSLVTYVGSLNRKLGRLTCWSKKTFMDYRNTSGAILASKSATTLSASIPKVLITRFISPEATVIYTLSLRALELISTFVNRYNAAVLPSLSHIYSEGYSQNFKHTNATTKFERFFDLLCLICLMLYCLLNDLFISIWVGEKYFAGPYFVCIAALYFYLTWRNNLFNIFLFSKEKIVLANLLAAGDHFIRVFLMIPMLLLWGMEGLLLGASISAVIFHIVFISCLNDHANGIAFKSKIKQFSQMMLLFTTIIFSSFIGDSVEELLWPIIDNLKI